MRRQTLPDFDPLAQLGIGQPPPSEVQPLPVRQTSAATTAKPRRVPAHEPKTPVTSTTSPEPAPDQPPAPTDQERPLSQPERPEKARTPQGRGQQSHLSLAATSTAAPRPPKAKTSGRIDAELWEEVRDCVVWHGHRMTIDRFTEEAFREHLARLRKRHELGQRFPEREHDPKQGRRVS